MTATPEIDQLLAEVRAGLDRVSPRDLFALVVAGALVVDTRPVEQRRRDGELPGAMVVDRNVLEWRLDPTSPYRLPEVVDKNRVVVVVCNEGFSSSLAAATLQRLGLLRATDLIGGFQEWARTVGLPSGGARAVSVDGLDGVPTSNRGNSGPARSRWHGRASATFRPVGAWFRTWHL